MGEALEWSWIGETILLPLTFDPGELSAVEVAFHLAECFGSNVIVYHAGKPSSQKHKRKCLEEVRKQSIKLRVKYEFIEEESHRELNHHEVFKRISEFAERNKIDLVVASRRKSFTFFGRVSERIVKEVRARVMLVSLSERALFEKAKRIMVISIDEEVHEDPLILASALVNASPTHESSLMATWVLSLPPTIPLDALEYSEELRGLKKKFDLAVVEGIKNLGKTINPRILLIRDFREDLLKYINKVNPDLVIVLGNRRAGRIKSRELKLLKWIPSPSIIVYPSLRKHLS